jgi:uncharacterized protein
MGSVYKIVITGATGAGKTTAIGAVSDHMPVRTDVTNTDPNVKKATTTVGLDYGEIALDSGDRLCLYGTPGQVRFDFMWRILAKGALGIVILCDNSAPEPLDTFDTYLSGFSDALKNLPCVVGVGRMDTHRNPSLDEYAHVLSGRGFTFPIIPIDVRDAPQVRTLLDLLLLQMEAKAYKPTQ